MTSISNRRPRLSALVANFPHFVKVFEEAPPFTRAGQLEFHLETIDLRRRCGSVAGALAKDQFLRALYRTLQAWGIGARASNLATEPEFAAALRAKTTELTGLDGLHIDDQQLHVNRTCQHLWRIISSLGIVSNNSTVVAGTKALHHILPELVVPIDRAYTQKFFRWHNPEFQYGQAAAFEHCFISFVQIARAVNPQQYVGTGWNSSRTKVIDNAVVGMLLDEERSAS